MGYETSSTTFPIFFLCSVLKLHRFLSCFTFLHGLSEFNVFIVSLATAHQINPRKKGENIRNVYLKIATQKKLTKSCFGCLVSHRNRFQWEKNQCSTILSPKNGIKYLNLF